MDFEADVSIDETSLDVEWLEQPRLMLSYAKNAAVRKADFDRAKENLEVVKAQLDHSIRENPEVFAVIKITETVVQNTIHLQKEYEEAYERYTTAKYELEIALAAVRAIEQKRSALENLVRLHGQQYFAGPSVPRDLSAEWERKQRQQKVDGGVARKLKRRKD